MPSGWALSVTYLQGLYIKDDPFRALLAEAPTGARGSASSSTRHVVPYCRDYRERVGRVYGDVFSSAPG